MQLEGMDRWYKCLISGSVEHSRALTGNVLWIAWHGWYRRAIPHAEQLYEEYLKEREAETEEGR
jgi:hypothetical protein